MSEAIPDWLRQPLLLEPYLRPMPWGGTRLAEWLGLPTPSEPIGEAWLVSDHPHHFSRILNVPQPRRGDHGSAPDWTLRALMQNWPQAILGYPAQRFPLLIKLIDARENLSVQVHPDDESARFWAPQEGGKTEAWVVLQAEPDGKIYLGLKPGITREVLQRELPLGTLPLCLNVYPAQVGQCYFVPAGTVHALGAGVCVLEVQQTSDATFRLYDWGRVDAHGKPRPLHIEAALAVLRESSPQAGPCTPVLRADGLEELVRCPYFAVYRLTVCGEYRVEAPAIVVALQRGLGILGGRNSPTGSAYNNSGAARTPSGRRDLPGLASIPLAHAVLLPAVAGSATLISDTASPCCLITWPGTQPGKQSAG